MAIEKSTFGDTRTDGSRIVLPETETVVKNVKTDEEYSDITAAQADVADSNTNTTQDDISQSVTLRVLKGVGADGGTS
jgi:hypothetical protein